MTSLADALYGHTTNPKFELKTASNGWQTYWVFKASNGQVLCTSEMYNSTQAAQDGIQSLVKNIKAYF